MPEPVIINASPLIFLARSRHIHLLQHLHRPILVPHPVVQEIRARGPHDPTVRVLNETTSTRHLSRAALARLPN
ncbi:MAG: hypothetical protein H7833_17760 [Magnetococcus sp. DMHC-1]